MQTNPDPLRAYYAASTFGSGDNTAKIGDLGHSTGTRSNSPVAPPPTASSSCNPSNLACNPGTNTPIKFRLSASALPLAKNAYEALTPANAGKDMNVV
ncbi:hypothetical protein LTR33_014561 [Friedmanniomyces endolithicus]|nr:hypothetical protein LTR33_014561 [Friedmanniomyces endolithicus]